MKNNKGVQFLVPVVFLGIIVAKAVDFMMVVAEPMADRIPVALKLGTAERIGFEIQKLPAEQVTYLDIPVTSIIEITENYGHGMAEALITDE